MKVFFHIGYPKAGSTSLQKQFFNLHPEIHFLGRYPSGGGNTGIETKEFDPNTPYLNSRELFDMHQKLVSEEKFDTGKYSTELKKIISETSRNEPVTVLSSEFVTSVFFALPDIGEKIRRIKALGVDGIILVIRNQAEIIKSQYREHPFDPEDLVHGKPMDLDTWVRKSDELDHSYLESLKFDRITDICNRLFGKQNVLILQFEDIISNAELPATKLSQRLALDKTTTHSILDSLTTENRGVSARYNMIRNLKKRLIGEFPISRFIPKNVFELIKTKMKTGKKADYRFSSDTIQFLNSYFYESNLRLAEEYGIDLKKFNYPPYYH